MAPLRPSADIPHVGTQKDIYGFRFAQKTIDELLVNGIHYPSSVFFSFLDMSRHICDSVHMQLVDHLRVLVFASRGWMYPWVSLIESHGSYASCPS